MHTPTRRRLTPIQLATMLSALGMAVALPVRAAAADSFDQLLNTSLSEKKGVVLYVNGQAIPGRVTRLDKDSVELSSREYARIVVRRDSIDAVAGN